MKTRAFQDCYEDILEREHPVSPDRKHLSMTERAAQFSPFAALTGHQDAVEETQRLTESYQELYEDQNSILNEKLQWILSNLSKNPTVKFTYFVPDERKAGGAYVETTGTVKKIEQTEHQIFLTDGTRIPMEQIYEITVLTQ